MFMHHFYKSLFALLFSILSLWSYKSYASHAMGADLTYTCLGGNTYRIRLSFYRDCIGINAPTSAYITITSASCGQSLGVTCYPIPGTGVQITPLCPSALSTCNGGTFTGIQEWIYEGIVTLPMQCPDWVFSYNLCCRNAAINTITNPGTSTFYIYATLNNTITPCNSSPVFSNKPVPFACLGQQFCFNHGTFDADGDSLAFQLMTPMQTAVTTVNYIPPYNATQPLNSVPPVQFNPSTGDICMVPQQLQVTVMAVLVKEYRNGVLIGTVERDIQITVIACNNQLPTLTGINGTNQYSATICANQPYCFNIFSSDPDPGQNVFVSWDGGIPGGTFTTTTAQYPTATFCWTPTDAHVGSQHCFTAMVQDNACPMNGTQIYSYCLTVVGVQANAGPDQFIACNDIATLYASASGGSGNYTYLWSNGSTNPGITVGPGTYILTVSDGMCSDTDTVQVISAFEPTANFSAVNACVNTPIQFTDLSILPGGIFTSWNWNFGDGTTSTQQNPVHTYASDGTYNVQLVVTTSLGCVDTVVIPVTVYPLPAVQFSAGNACLGTAITFNNNTVPSGSSYTWNFGNGQTSGATNPVITYSDTGTYIVTLTATSPFGCVNTFSASVTVYPLPVAAFNFNPTGTCQGSSITFNNTSGGGATYQWNFGNGQTSNATNPSVVYNSPGSYDVTLTVTSANSCVSTVTQTVIVYPLPVATINPPQSICQGGTAVLIASGGITYQWNTGATTDVITVNPPVNTTYTVTVTDANGCTATAQVQVTVNPLPVPVVSPNQSICIGQSVTLTASGGVSYYWNPSGHTTGSITVTPGSSTTYAVNVTDINGCTGTGFVNVTVYPLPVVNLPNSFVCPGQSVNLNAGNPGATYVWSTGATTQTISVSTAGTYTVTVTSAQGCSASSSAVLSVGGTITNNLTNASFCQGGSAVLDAGNIGSTYLWSTGATTQQITVHTSGTYSVTITDANGCSGTVSTTVNVFPLPQAQFIPNDVCIGDSMYFTDISTITSGAIVSWQWNFGDGNVSQQQNPIHIYSTPGSYQVTLTVTSDQGCVGTIVKTFNVFPLPQANFNFNNACTGSPVSIVNTSTVSVGNITSWNYQFGDGNSSILQNPVHVYSTPGVYPITLIVTTNGGCRDTITKLVTIYPLPQASFTAPPVCAGNSTVFTSTSTVAGGVITSWQWSFGNAATSTAQNPVYQYNSSGTYMVTLITTSSHGCTASIQQPVTVYPLPAANAGPDQSVCPGTSVTLTATGGTSYQWSPGGQTTASITITPSATTQYMVTVTDNNGCTNSDTVRIQLNPVPVVNAGPDVSICQGSAVTLTATGSNNYLWTPGGATTGTITVSPVSTTYYVVSTTNGHGCSNSDTVRVTVNPLPVVSAGPDISICSGTTATLTATGGVSYQWHPTGSTSATIYVNPQVNTSYQVVATDANGCQNRDTVNVVVQPSPVVNFTPGFICQGSTLTLNAGNPGSTYLWFPGGETTQSIVVSAAGTYSVLVTNSFGCQTQGQVQITVGGTGLTSNLTPAHFCAGASAVLDAGNPGSTYLWSTGATSQTINVTSAGTYTVTVTDATGCSATYQAAVTVHPLPQVSFSALPVCENFPTLFSNTTTISSGNIITWHWNFGDGNVSSAQQPVHHYAAGTYSVTLTAISGNGCSASATQSVVVHSRPEASFVSNIVCHGDATQFQDFSTSSAGTITDWQWYFGDGDSTTGINPQHIYQIAGTYVVTLIITDSNGCHDTLISSATVHPTPRAYFSATEVCHTAQTNFTDLSSISPGNIDTWEWFFGDGNSSTVQHPDHTYLTDGTFFATLVVTSDMGCSDTITQPVRVNPLPELSITATPVCLNQSILFNGNATINSGSIQTWYWEFGDNTFSGIQNPSHQYNAAGSYNVMLVAVSDKGCSDSAYYIATVYDLPHASFSFTDACLNSASPFTDQSTVQGSAVVSWMWHFGDGTSSSVQHPSHVYASPGSYSVTLTVTSAQGCVSSVTQSVNVFDNPAANFSTGNVCLGTATAFYNQSTLAGGGLVSCLWNFGDGSTGSGPNPIHTYSASGVYQVTLTATSANGCTGTVTLPVEVYPLPLAQANFSNACVNTPVHFTDLSSVPGGIPITQWSWNLGDGTISQSQHPIHQYAVAGVYGVSLTVTSLHGCTHTIQDSIRIYAAPLASIVASAGCVNDPVSFVNGSDSLNLDGNTFLWNFGDGNTSTQIAPVHYYAAGGVYQVTLEVTSQHGCKTSVTIPIVVNPQPDAGFSAANACAGTPVQFTNQSTISSGSIVGYQWNFGNGQTSTQVNPSHSYSQPGTYVVTLIAISDQGCTDTASLTLTIYPVPVAHFTAMNHAGCGPLPVYFTDSSFIDSGNIIAWQWNFGDGGTDSVQNPVHIYLHSGQYQVSLTVTSDNGCQHTVTIPNAVTVYPQPLADFQPSPPETNILNPVITFYNLSQGANYYQWNFGDGSTSGQVTPTHTYQDTGWYQVQLLVMNQYGCIDTVMKWVYIEPITTLFIPNAFTPNGDGLNDLFMVKGINILDVKLAIWNRWGDMIYYTDDAISYPWDGSVINSSHQAKQDVYVYEAWVTDVFKRKHRHVGRVSLIR